MCEIFRVCRDPGRNIDTFFFEPAVLCRSNNLFISAPAKVEKSWSVSYLSRQKSFRRETTQASAQINLRGYNF